VMMPFLSATAPLPVFFILAVAPESNSAAALSFKMVVKVC